MVAVAQSVEHWIVDPAVAGSIPVGHPIFRFDASSKSCIVKYMAQAERENGRRESLQRELVGLFLLFFSILLLIANLSFTDGLPQANLLGIAGYGICLALAYLFGLGSFPLIFCIGWVGYCLIKGIERDRLITQLLAFTAWLISTCFLLNLAAELNLIDVALFRRYVYSQVVSLPYPYPHTVARFSLGGVPSYFLYKDLSPISLRDLLSDLGLALSCLVIQICSLMFLLNLRPADLLAKANQKSSRKEPTLPRDPLPEKQLERSLTLSLRAPPSLKTSSPREKTAQEPKVVTPVFSEKSIKINRSMPAKPLRESNSDLPPQEGYTFPPLSLLTNAQTLDAPTLAKDLKKQASILEETLQSFGIEATVGQIHCGPTITSFEVHPAVGVKVQKITALANDIALNLQAKTIRIIAPIPGKAAVGVEIPSLYPQEVGFKEMLQNYRKQTKKCLIPILLGKTVTGEEVIADLAKMPHCIIAGATGSGKSVCINTMIMSILMNATPDDIRLILIDPKKVELTPFSSLPHLIAPVITEAPAAYAALQWIVREMERRYELLKQLGVRNITSFNHREINPELEGSLSIPVPKKMPMIVAIIDEFADLMMTASADLETPIARIAQMARAVGIHLVLATQRPSREVITGLIKANFPTRIAFKVASRVNSQIILDDNGAETLLGNGDMLFLPPGSSLLIRAQGVYIRDEDIHRVIDYLAGRYPPRYLFNSFEEDPHADAGRDLDDPEDTLYEKALDVVLETGNASTTFLQRKLKIGYARAASLIDALEDRGVISAADGARPRRVLQKNPMHEDEGSQ